MLAYYYENNINESLKNINIALDMDPNNKRLIENKKIIEEKNSKENL